MLILLLIAAITVGETTGLDFVLQDRFFDPQSRTWAVDATAPLPRLLFYDGPKIAIIALGACLIALAAGPARWRTRFHTGRARVIATVLVLGVTPAFVGFLKGRSDVYCPAQLTRYGGDQTYRRPFSPRPAEPDKPRRGHCWPAGHASGGFALVGLALLAKTRRRQRLGLAVGLLTGWTMGAYQMLKGAHFLSHTVITMLVALLFAALAARALAGMRAPRGT